MYQQFYGLEDLPFRLAPDPRYLFRSESLLEVLANLQYGIECGKGLLVITGEVGSGKTTALRSHLQLHGANFLSAYVFNPLLSTEEFFDTLAGELRLRPQPAKSAMLRSIGDLLLSRHQMGLRTVLVIDEAHLLPIHLLEEIRLLSNFETSREKLLQIVLSGQPELIGLLEMPEMRQLKQRISLRCHIQPMSARETSAYIRLRLRIAGSKGRQLFDTDAIFAVHQLSGGIPRVVNNICDNALLTGFGRGAMVITPDIIQETAEELFITEPRSALQGGAESSRALGIPATHLPPADGGTGVLPRAPRSDNVRYIQPHFGHSGDRAPSDGVRFIIEFGDGSSDAASRFFSKVKVTKSSQSA